MTGSPMEEDAVMLSHVNAMPAPTWHRLHVNDADVEIPAGLAVVHDVRMEGDADALPDAAPSAFDDAVASLQRQVDEAREKCAGADAAAAEEEAEAADAGADDDADAGAGADDDTDAGADADSDATDTNDAAHTSALDEVALSAYQKNAEAVEASGSIVEAFKTGMGPATREWLLEAAGDPHVIATSPDQEGGHVVVQLSAVFDAVNVAALDIVAAEASHLSVSIVQNSEEFAVGGGVVGDAVRVFAGKDARVDLVVTQTLDEGFIALDDTGIILADGAQVNVRHTILGADVAMTGLAADLRGNESAVDVDTRYLGTGSQRLDFNYEISHHGADTESSMRANGVLSGESEKTLRGTIDLVRGCKGATGGETETVLLTDETVRNHTVPVILCDEDDVAGNHGATIGHVRAEQRFYLGCRGLDDESIERLFSRSVLEEAALTAPDDFAREAVMHRAQTLLDDDLEDVLP